MTTGRFIDTRRKDFFEDKKYDRHVIRVTGNTDPNTGVGSKVYQPSTGIYQFAITRYGHLFKTNLDFVEKVLFFVSSGESNISPAVVLDFFPWNIYERSGFYDPAPYRIQLTNTDWTSINPSTQAWSKDGQAYWEVAGGYNKFRIFVNGNFPFTLRVVFVGQKA